MGDNGITIAGTWDYMLHKGDNMKLWIFIGCLLSSPSLAQNSLCEAIPRASRTIAGGLSSIPAQVMMDGSIKPPLLIPGTNTPVIKEQPGPVMGEPWIYYTATIYVGRNDNGGPTQARAIYADWIQRIKNCFRHSPPLIHQTSPFEEETNFDLGGAWRVTVSRGQGMSRVGISSVDIIISLRKGYEF